MTGLSKLLPMRRILQRLKRDGSGVAYVEFALAIPFFMGFGFTAIDLSRLALAHLKVSQIALNLADNVSRVGITANASDLSEADVNDAFEAVRDQGAGIRFVNNGRLILSSLENGPRDGQRIHWQRCIGLKSGAGYDSSYGVATPLTTAGINTNAGNIGLSVPNGMGRPGAMVNAPTNSGVMFVEANYEFRPIFGPISGWAIPTTRIHYIASFIVRDNRGYNNATAAPIIKNSTTSPVPRATCNLYTT
jgi:hypothetical protein